MSNNYISAWVWYLLSAGILQWLVWHLSRFLKHRDIRMILNILSLCILFTPVPVAGDSAYWAPVFMAALIDTITLSVNAGLQRLWVLLSVMLLAVLVSFGWRVLRYKKNQGAE